MDMIDPDSKNIGFLPLRSANGPRTSGPKIAPLNNMEAIKAVSSSLKFHSSRRTSDKNDKRRTCIASAAKQRPAAVKTNS